MMPLIKADIIKLKSTQLIWMHLYVPILGLIIFLAYYSYTPWSSFDKISIYLQVLSIVFPILIGIVTSIVADQESIAGGFQNILIASKVKCLSFISKLVLLLLLGTFSTILATIGFYVGSSIMEYNMFPITMYLAVVGILIGSNVFLYILHLFISFRFSKGVSIGIGIVESLATALFLTGMGNGRWPFVPSTWSIRFVGSLLMKYQNSGNMLFDPNLKLGIAISIITTFLSFIVMSVWFTGWEGRRAEE